MCSFFFFFFFLPNRPTHLHEREGDGKRNILWGWPKPEKKNCMSLTVAWISSDYFESLLLPQRRKRLEAIGWISGYVGCPCRSPSFGFCSSFLVWFCFLWNWPPLWNIELPSGSNKNFNFIPWWLILLARKPYGYLAARHFLLCNNI